MKHQNVLSIHRIYGVGMRLSCLPNILFDSIVTYQSGHCKKKIESLFFSTNKFSILISISFQIEKVEEYIFAFITPPLQILRKYNKIIQKAIDKRMFDRYNTAIEQTFDTHRR